MAPEKAISTKKRKFKGLKIGLSILIGLWLIVTVALHFALTSSFLTKTASKYTAEYIDGNLEFGSIEASMFRNFPNLNISFKDVSLTYPNERFAAYDSIGINSVLRQAGRGEAADTLASFKELSISLNYISALTGRIKVHRIALDKARVFAHRFDSTAANWNIFVAGEKKEEETGSIPRVIIKEISLKGGSSFVFTSPADTVFASVDMKNAVFEGSADISDLNYSRSALDLDSLSMAVRLPSDTAAIALKHLSLKGRNTKIWMRADAEAFLATRAMGRLDIPMLISGEVDFPEKNPYCFSIKKFMADIAMLKITGEGDVRLGKDSTYIKAELSLNDCSVMETADFFLKKLMPDALKLQTDAKINLTALCDGYYIPAEKTMPQLIAQVVIPKSSIKYEGLDYSGIIEVDINAQTDKYGKVSMSLDALDAHLAGMNISGYGSADDVLGPDPMLDLDLKATASLDTIDELLPEHINAQGNLEAALSGLILVSDINPYNFSRADLEGFIKSNGIKIQDEKNKIFAFLDKTEIKLGKAGKDAELGAELLGFSGNVDSVKATFGENTFIRGTGIYMTAQNAIGVTSQEYGREVHPIVGTIGARHIAMIGQDSLFIGINNSRNSFKLSNKEDGDGTVPILSFVSSNEDIFVRSGINRLGVRDSRIAASAVMKGSESRQRKEIFLDSLQKVYPGISRDSLIGHMIAMRQKDLPDYMKEEDFSKKDIKFNISESMTRYVRDWNIGGNLKIEEGLFISPYFPLKNTFSEVEGGFNNNEINIKNITFTPGNSDISATGKLTGLRNAILGGRSPMNLKIDIKSKKIDANEILKAYDAGSRFVPTALADAMSEKISDEEYLSRVTADKLADSTDNDYKLIVIPANLNARISLQGNEIRYSNLHINWFASDLNMKERCLQVTNTVATSNMGDIYFEGFYSTKSKADLRAGFDLNMVDITADKVITLFPAVDSITPMLKSFKGMLDCEIAATSSLDTNMNLIPHTINGITKIKGSNLSLEENGALKKLAKTLMFKDRNFGNIKDMSVQGLITNNTLEVFPFVMRIDRYILAMSGLQNFDQSFKYHVSVLKSPVPFRFGINITGNFDKWKYNLGRAKYKNTNVPVFTSKLDAMQLNLLNSIHNIFTKGVEVALQQSSQSVAEIDKEKEAAGYDSAIVTDSLSAEEKHLLDSTKRAIEQPVDSVLSSKIDSVLKSISPAEKAKTEENKPEIKERGDKSANSANKKAYQQYKKGGRKKVQDVVRKKKREAEAVKPRQEEVQ